MRSMVLAALLGVPLLSDAALAVPQSQTQPAMSTDSSTCVPQPICRLLATQLKPGSANAKAPGLRGLGSAPTQPKGKTSRQAPASDALHGRSN